jgi:hypothetical protein
MHSRVGQNCLWCSQTVLAVNYSEREKSRPCTTEYRSNSSTVHCRVHHRPSFVKDLWNGTPASNSTSRKVGSVFLSPQFVPGEPCFASRNGCQMTRCQAVLHVCCNSACFDERFTALIDIGPDHLQHHCRYCGEIFCDDCSTGRRAIPQFNLFNPVRICRVCDEILA